MRQLKCWLCCWYHLSAAQTAHINNTLSVHAICREKQNLLEIQFLYSWLLAKVKRLPIISPKWEVPAPLEHSLNVINCQKWGETPYQNMIFWETLRINLMSSFNLSCLNLLKDRLRGNKFVPIHILFDLEELLQQSSHTSFPLVLLSHRWQPLLYQSAP